MRLRRTRQTELRPRAGDAARCAASTPTRVPPEVIDRSVTLLEEREDVEGMDRAFLAAARSLLRLLVDPRRYRTAMASIRVPVLLVHGDRDRLVPVAAARDIARRHPALALPRAGRRRPRARSCRCPSGWPARCSAGWTRPRPPRAAR